MSKNSESPKKLLIFGPCPANAGGIEKNIQETLKIIDSCQIISATLICFSKSFFKMKVNPYKKVKVYSINQNFFLFYIRNLYKIIKKERENVDYVHIHGTGNFESFLVSFFLRKFSYILTPHYHPKGSNHLFNLLKQIYDPIFVKYQLKKSKKIICVSEIERGIILQKFGKSLSDKIEIIPNGVDIERIQKAKRIPGYNNLILYVGRLEKHKNVNVLIKIFKNFPKNYQLLIIGSGKERSSLHNLVAEYNLFDRVHFKENLSDDEIYCWMRTCSVFINFSDIEAFGISVLEALVLNKPVVVNNRLGLSELAKKFPEAICAVDIHSENNHDLVQYIINAENKSFLLDLKEYSWKRITQKLLDTYRGSR